VCQRSLPRRAAEWKTRRWAEIADASRARAGGASLLVALAIAVFGVASLCWQEELPTRFWTPGHTGAVILIVLGVAAAIGSFLSAFSLKPLLAEANLEGELIRPCREMAWFWETQVGLPRGSVGVHVWQVAGPPFARRLSRRGTFRAKTGRETAVLWTRGKGAIGQCWDLPQKDRVFDLAELRRLGPDEERFCALAPRVRLEMTWEEFGESPQYDLVWVAKLFKGKDARRLWGVMSVDVEGDGHRQAVLDALAQHAEDVRDVLSMCDEILARSPGP
jgi:hypothetical protein